MSMDAQLQNLIVEMSAALADIVTAMNEKTQSSDQISSALADIVQALEIKSEGTSLDNIAKAISKIRPQIVVQPAEVVVQVIEGEFTYTGKFNYDNFDRITDFSIKKIPVKV